MAHDKYFVVLDEGQWKISYNGKHYGPYSTQAKANRVAIDTAKKSGDKGNQAQVFVQGRDSKFRAEWTYGDDPYPPPG